ncbi:uncharacterized protein LOC131313317 isoform X3 [Rhododendron vialii]|uniref:uncharacterized protein LOC131313317 isoform X3 n=1 Tax=Rhododendron vialii TaxID=182163 RepID=UPI00265DAC64|nr:uncharacterized protein LOC131313317 isoform X3 [Rhododendron vialii]
MQDRRWSVFRLLLSKSVLHLLNSCTVLTAVGVFKRDGRFVIGSPHSCLDYGYNERERVIRGKRWESNGSSLRDSQGKYAHPSLSGPQLFTRTREVILFSCWILIPLSLIVSFNYTEIRFIRK